MSVTAQDIAVWTAESRFETEATLLKVTAIWAASEPGLPECVSSYLKKHCDRFEAAKAALREARRAQEEARRAP